jgi:signal transduction histidine kinase
VVEEIEGEAWELRIEDDGIGFDPAASRKLGHQGLANIRDRAQRIGGDVTIDTASGLGSRLRVRVPATQSSGVVGV